MPVSLHARLLRLCALAYAVQPGDQALPSGRQTVDAARDAQIGLAGSFKIIGRSGQKGTDRDVAIIGRIAEGIVIAARGTQPPELGTDPSKQLSILRDWLNNGDIRNRHSGSFEGFVHGGFGEAANGLWDDDSEGPGLHSALAWHLEEVGKPKRIFVTGHSKGGPVANLIAWRIRKDFDLGASPLEAVTFAAARPGNTDFKKDFESRGIAGFRYETSDDIVPKLPLGQDVDGDIYALLQRLGIGKDDGGIGFVPVGGAISETPQPLIEMANPFGERLLRTVRLLKRIAVIVESHKISAGSRYDRLVDASARAVADRRASIFGTA